MKNRPSVIRTAAASAAVLLLSSAAHAVPYFKCQSGYSFDVNSNGTGAHCRMVIPPVVHKIVCPQISFMGSTIGTFASTRRNKDVCRGTLKVAGVTNSTEVSPLACPSGHSYRTNYQGNRDRCVKGGSTDYKAPNRSFNSN